MNENDLTKIVTDLIVPIKRAGALLMEIYSQETFDSQIKITDIGKDDVTQADLVVDEYLYGYIKRNFPDYGVISEEKYKGELDKIKSEMEKEYCWTIDGCDGSTDFKNRTGEFVLMVSLLKMKDYKPVLGMIYKPTTRELFSAVENRGAFQHLDDGGSMQKLKVSNVDKLNLSHLVVSQFHNERIMGLVLDDLKEKIRKKTEIGSGGNKMASVSKGESDWYFRMTEKIPYWDIAPGHIIVQESGGKFTDLKLDNVMYNHPDFRHRGGLLVSNGLLHESAYEALKEIKNNLTPPNL